jgi:flavin reductase (DIM6/NTAB) family NADH-FMN oxidoreductase RutF
MRGFIAKYTLDSCMTDTASPTGHTVAPPVDTGAPFELRDLRAALGTYTTGITVVTARAANGERIGLTVNSFNSVSLEPPLVLWSLGLNSPNIDAFRAVSHYAVNVLAEDQAEVSQRFASRQFDKFAGLECCEGVGGAPLLPGCCAWFECRNDVQYPGGDHLILLGHVERFAHQAARAPLVYSRGAYRHLKD